jgi:Sigma-70, region 4
MLNNPSLEQLPPDQQAVISLLVRQGQTYSQVASMLKIEPQAVRARAHQALLGLAGRPGGQLNDEETGQIGDYLLGQLSEAERIETLALLLETPDGRSWARDLATRLAPMAKVPLPAVPDESEASGESSAPPAVEIESAEAQPDHAVPAQARRARTGPAAARPARARTGEPGSGLRRGVLAATGVILLAALIVLITSGGSTTPPRGPIPANAGATTSSAANSATGASSGSGTATGASTGTGNNCGNAQVLACVTLSAASGSNATGVVAVVKTGSTESLAFQAANLPQPGTSHYVLWLYDSATHFRALGVVPSVKSNGAVGPLEVSLPSDASSYHGVLLTLETGSSPTAPGQAVLSGSSSSAL